MVLKVVCENCQKVYRSDMDGCPNCDWSHKAVPEPVLEEEVEAEAPEEQDEEDAKTDPENPPADPNVYDV